MSNPGMNASNGLQPAPQQPEGEPTAPANALGVAADAAPAADAPADDIVGHMANKHSQQMSQYDKLREAKGRIDAARKAMDGLVEMGDTVKQEDVVNAASGLVAAGLGAAAVAGLLSEMPPDGASLQGWIEQQDQGLQQREQQLTQALDVTRHRVAVSSLKHIAAHSMMQGAAPEAAPDAGAAAASSNPLMSGDTPNV